MAYQMAPMPMTFNYLKVYFSSVKPPNLGRGSGDFDEI